MLGGFHEDGGVRRYNCGEVVAGAPLWEPALISADIDAAATRRVRREVPLVAEARLGLIQRELAGLGAEDGDA